jgi:hypothetical protein
MQGGATGAIDGIEANRRAGDRHFSEAALVGGAEAADERSVAQDPGSRISGSGISVS